MKRLSIITMAAFACLGMSQVEATVPYSPVGFAGAPGFGGPTVSTPDLVNGKEFSHDDYWDGGASDRDSAASSDPLQIVNFDGKPNSGSGSGVVDGIDFGPGALHPNSFDIQIDALANHADFAFRQVLDDSAHLLFSVDDTATVMGTPGGTVEISSASSPITTVSGLTIGNPGEINVY